MWQGIITRRVGINMIKIKNHDEGLTLALYLAVTAESSKQVKECLHLASNLARTMSPKEIEYCKKAVEVMLEYEKTVNASPRRLS
jgi:hypothetical protein